MTAKPEQSFENTTTFLRIGSLEHLDTLAQQAAESSIETVKELQDYLDTNNIPESLAYFIFQYQTRETRRYWTPEKTAVIDTHGLTGYEPSWPTMRAEYHYEPMLDRNYIHIVGEPNIFDDPEPNYSYNYGYHMHIPLTDALELDVNGLLEAHMHFGNPVGPKEVRSFRSYADKDPRYDTLRDPSLFIKVLQKTTNGLKDYLIRRDYL
jgi:hypothetical protein